MEVIPLILGSSFLAGVVGSWMTAQIANRKIEIENITQERAKWREKIRENAIEVSKSILEGNEEELSRLRSKFMLLLNPLDKEDNGIIASIQIANEGQDPKSIEKEFTQRVSLLLKHDWERAKFEALPWHQKCGEKDPSRKMYEEYKYK